MVIRRDDDCVIVGSSVTSSLPEIPVRQQRGSMRIVGPLTTSNEVLGQPCKCLCGHCNGLTYHIELSLLHSWPNAYEYDYLRSVKSCSVGSGTNPDLSPSLELDAQESKRKGIRTVEERISAWGDGCLPAGSLQNPEHHPEWESTYTGPWRWSEFLGITGLADVKEIVGQLLQISNEHLSDATKYRFMSCAGLLIAIAKRLKISVNEAAKLAVHDPTFLIGLLKDRSGHKGGRRNNDADAEQDTSEEPWTLETLQAELEATNHAPRGFWSEQELADAETADVLTNMWRGLTLYGEEKLFAMMDQAIPLPILRKKFEVQLSEVRRHLTGTRGWHEAYAVWRATVASFKYEKSSCPADLAVFNLSDPGAHKTSTVFAIAKELNPHNVLILAPSTTVNVPMGKFGLHWKNQAEWEGEDQANFIIAKDASFVDELSDTRRNYVLVTEYTLQNNSDNIVEAICTARWDFMVLDEFQLWSGSGNDADDPEKFRTRHLKLVCKSLSPKCLKYAMSATPVRTRIKEALTIFEILTGNKQHGIDVKGGISSLLQLRSHLLKHGFRFYIDETNVLPPFKQVEIYDVPGIELKISDGILEVGFLAGSDLIADFNTHKPNLDAETRITSRVLEVIEAHPLLLQVFKGAKSPVLYTGHFVNGPIELLKQFTKKCTGKDPIIHTGEDKHPEGLEEAKKRGCAIVASSPISTGFDGLQHIPSDTMFITSPPWHFAGLKQLLARIRRPGQMLPVMFVVFVAKDAKYHLKRWLRVRMRRSECDCLLDAKIPLPSMLENEQVERLMKEAKAHIGIMVGSKTLITPTTPAPAINSTAKRRIVNNGPMARLHNKWSNAYSETMIQKRKNGDIPDAELAEYHRLNEKWNSDQRSDGRCSFEKVYEDFVIPHPESHIADLGCGTDAPAYAQDRGIANVTFVDPFLPESYYQKHPGILRADRTSTGLPSESLDLIVNVLSCFSKPLKASILEMSRLLVLGGKAVIVESYLNKNWVKKRMRPALEAAGFVVDMIQLGHGIMQFVAVKSRR